MNSKAGLVVLALKLALLLPQAALAVPSTRSASDSDDDAKITVTVLSQVILGDIQSYCSVRIEVGSSDVGWSSGDTVELWVYEDDVVGDDEIWHTKFTVTSAERTAGRVDRTFTCSNAFGDDVGDEAEIYAEAEVVKDDCGTFCMYDRPETGNIDVTEVQDDAEGDDTSAAAKPLGLGLTANRIGRDQDWYRFELASPAAISLVAEHMPSVGRLDVTLFDSSNTLVDSGWDTSVSTRVDVDFLAAGLYRARIQPRVSNNYEFYDMRLLVEPLATECFPGTVDVAGCGNCGSMSRVCNETGRWTPFSACVSEGLCSPGSVAVDSCGFCGTITSICSTSCEWDAGTCTGAGVCEPDTTEMAECDGGGTRERSCDAACHWSEYTACMGDECIDGEMPCYDAPSTTRGVGACRDGVQVCEDGFLYDCTDQVLPSNEVCDDGIDNDCDGDVDDEDLACQKEKGAIGDSCFSDSDCEEPYLCLTAPEDDVFIDGYCGDVDCLTDSECGDGGICAELFGEAYCLQECESDVDCREDYLCLDFGDAGACVPPCRADRDCGDPSFPVCDWESGICVEEEVDDPVTVHEDDEDGDDGASTGTTSGSDGGSPPVGGDDGGTASEGDDEPDSEEPDVSEPAEQPASSDDDPAETPAAENGSAGGGGRVGGGEEPASVDDLERTSTDEVSTRLDQQYIPDEGCACAAAPGRPVTLPLVLMVVLGLVMAASRRRRA